MDDEEIKRQSSLKLKRLQRLKIVKQRDTNTTRTERLQRFNLSYLNIKIRVSATKNLLKEFNYFKSFYTKLLLLESRIHVY